MKKHYLGPLIAAVCLMTSSPLLAFGGGTCICELGQVESLLKDIRSAIRDSQGTNWHLRELREETKSNFKKQTAADLKNAEYIAAAAKEGTVQQTVAQADTEAVRATKQSQPAGACEQANDMEKVSLGLRTAATTDSAMRELVAERLREVKDPDLDLPRFVEEYQKRDWEPDFVASDAGTMDQDQLKSYLKFVRAIMPTPFRSPTLLPDSVKTKPAAVEYEIEYKRYEAEMKVLNKIFMRDGLLSVGTIPAPEGILDMWQQISAGYDIPDELKKTEDGEDPAFVNHWAGISLAEVPGAGSYISERDYIRTEVFKRYGNPHYWSDPKYGLASHQSTESLLKELIVVVSLSNRMLYEMMNSALHEKQLTALDMAKQLHKDSQAKFSALEVDMAN